MRMTTTAGAMVLAMALVAGAAPAGAQIILDAPMLQEKKPPPRMPDVKAAPLAWPRLDPGAVLCRTEGDLDRLAARRQGDEGAGPADCRVMSNPTAITILLRRGPGRTQVRLTDAPTITGWTDAWLPERAPTAQTRQAGR